MREPDWLEFQEPVQALCVTLRKELPDECSEPQRFAEALGAALDRIATSMVLFPLCESPIEVILGAALVRRGLTICEQAQEPLSTGIPLLIPQYKFSRYRADFAVRPLGSLYIFVECDGRDFHSSEWQQKRDKAKDAIASRAGIPVIRFTGSQIVRDADACAARIVGMM